MEKSTDLGFSRQVAFRKAAKIAIEFRQIAN
jgi:hypothetical protein